MLNVEFIRPTEGTVVIAFHGDHDIMTREMLRECLKHEIASNELVVVDVSDAKFIDSTFLHNLWDADRLARESGSRFVLQTDSGTPTRRLIEHSQVLRDIDWADTREGALRPKLPDRVGKGLPA